MSKTFRFNDDLSSILGSSPEPFVQSIKETLFDGVDDYSELDITDYSIYADNTSENTPNYTLISGKKEKDEKSGNKDQNEDGNKQVPKVQDVIASKMFEQSKMSTINTVYIGSLTIIGLYVLFKYMKY